MLPSEAPLQVLAALLMPADPARRGVVTEADGRWRVDRFTAPPDADVVVWGRGPAPSGTPKAEAVAFALARERALRALRHRSPHPFRVAAVHRMPPPALRAQGPAWRVRAALLQGALIEFASGSGCPRVLDAVAAAAGAVGGVRWFRPGSGGAGLAGLQLRDGDLAVLRAAQKGSAVDPLSSAEPLETLAAAGVDHVPRLVRRGVAVDISWTVESALSGRRPRRVGARLLSDVAAFCARLPSADGRPAALDADLTAMAARLPERAARIARLAAEVGASTAGLPGTARHGDLWAGNLLVVGDRLSGVVDWDAWHPAAALGSDLVQLIGTEQRIAAHQSLGAAWLDRPWRSARGAAVAGYWRALDIAPDDELLEIAGIGWWAVEIAETLRRLPHRARDERWVEANVDPVLAALLG